MERVAQQARTTRTKAIKLAWSTSLVSKTATIALQLISVPLLYRALGEGGFATYAAVTASAGLIANLNLGIGGSLVTPIAEAAANGDEHRQAVLVQAGLKPLLLLCLLGAAVAIPAAALLPLPTLFGNAGSTVSSGLRLAALIAISATLATVPLSATDFLRQAFQELHITNLFSAASNAFLCFAVLIATKRSSSVAVYVALFTVIPLLTKVANCGALFSKKRYLMRRHQGVTSGESWHLLSDGVRYLSAAFSSVLVYQWPVYWIARTLPANESARFAICMQAVILPISFVIGFLQPLWSSTADASARGDHAWLNTQIRKGRIAIAVAGVCGIPVALVIGQNMVRLWIRQPITLDWQTRALIGAYILLAIWEYLHFILALGVGRMHEAAGAVFQRALCFAIAVPLLTAFGGPKAIWCGMILAILLWTGWRLPRLLNQPVTCVECEAAIAD